MPEIKKSKLSVYSFLPLLAAIVWGFGFVAQVSGIESVPPIFYNGVRFILASIVLIPLFIILDRKTYKTTIINTIKYGSIAGIFLCIAASIQQFGLVLTSSAAKGGFFTSLYAIFISIGEFLIFKKKISKYVWISVFVSIVGLLLICLGSDGDITNFTVTAGDLVLLLCAVAFAAHIIFIDKVIEKVSPVLFSIVQFFTVGIISLIYSLIFEDPTLSAIKSAGIPILYGGVVSCGIGYTLQIFSQKSRTPILTGIMFSTESAFALLGGALILHERLNAVSILGCVLVLFSVVLSQISGYLKKL